MRARSSGILLHPTSLPGRHGVGDLGAEAMRFVDRLAGAGVGLWQMLPVTVPGAFGSPYDCRSAFAGNPLLISPDALAKEGLLPRKAAGPALDAAAVDLPAATAHKEALLRASWEHFQHRARPLDRERFAGFRRADEQHWLADWALFAVLDARFEHQSWDRWPVEMRRRQPEALRRMRRELATEIDYQSYLQFLFFRQFGALRAHAERSGVRLCGDLPMYVSQHSADVWAHPDLFELAADGRPAAVAGVPPDAFSDTGQLWGNPVYRWPRHRELGYRWWCDRLRLQTSLFSVLRLDHFRGFVAYWRVPTPADDARGGHWVRGPGRGLFEKLRTELGDFDLIAEDLGHITPAVLRLRDRLRLPGTKVLQFAFGETASVHLPSAYDPATVAYTGTHDNDTLLGWLETLDTETRDRVTGYLDVEPATTPADMAWRLIERVLESPANLAVIPAQDLLGLGREARMNTPGTVYDNWTWRMEEGALDDSILERLRLLVIASGRSTLPAKGLKSV